MKMRTAFILFIALTSLQMAKSQQPGHKTQSQVLLSNGWSLTLVGKHIPLGDLPLNMAVSPDRSLLAVTNNGDGMQTIQLIDVKAGKSLQSLEVAKSWYGLKFSG